MTKGGWQTTCARGRVESASRRSLGRVLARKILAAPERNKFPPSMGKLPGINGPRYLARRGNLEPGSPGQAAELPVEAVRADAVAEVCASLMVDVGLHLLP